MKTMPSFKGRVICTYLRHTDPFIWVFLGVAVFILWQMLLPGYVLTMDMVFAPQFIPNVSAEALNFLPIAYLLYALSFLIPGWIIQKIILIIVFFIIGYFSFRFLPLPPNMLVRFFSALLYTTNPFVYTRFLAGRWLFLIAYGLFPLFIYTLFSFIKKPTFKTSAKLFISILFIGMFSIHIFVIAVLITFFVLSWKAMHFLITQHKKQFFIFVKNTFVGILLLCIGGSYWFIPFIIRQQPVEQVFNRAHWEVFSPSPHGEINTTVNLLSLHGFWGEREEWARYFAWAQESSLFWISFSAIALLVMIGVAKGLISKHHRSAILFFSILGVASFLVSAGAGDTIFKEVNLWLYEHVFFWPGFRDSQKFSAVLALSYAVLAGYGAYYILEYMYKKGAKYADVLSPLILTVPILFGFLLWGGFQKQLQPLWYPQSWHAARTIIQDDTSDFKILFLPWHGYFSLDFANKLIVANPARDFFGNTVIASKSIEIGTIYDQETDYSYRIIDWIMRGEINFSNEEIIKFLKQKNVTYILYAKDLGRNDVFPYSFLDSDELQLLIGTPEMNMYKIRDD